VSNYKNSEAPNWPFYGDANITKLCENKKVQDKRDCLEARVQKTLRGRFAPSPTGLLHLGNAWAFLCAWLGARSVGGSIVLRFEDIDPQRSRPEFAVALQEDLLWLGLDWDEGPYWQSHRIAKYAAALEEFKIKSLVYPCFCTRKELRFMAGAPHASDVSSDAANVSYPGFCRNLSEKERTARINAGCRYSWRLRFTDKCPPKNIRPEKNHPEKNHQEQCRPAALEFEDLVLGKMGCSEESCSDDFPLCRSDGVFAYQLAVVLDDIDMGITQVVRGADILSSTCRQLYLYSLLGATPPAYAHIPLLLDHKGERLAKRHAALSLRGLREAGVKAEAVIGYLAHWSGLCEGSSNCFALRSPQDLIPCFNFTAIKAKPERLPANITDILKRAGGQSIQE
jgi:glutamyl-tRNA synthetase